MEKSKWGETEMQKISDKVVKMLICGTFIIVNVSAAQAAGVPDLGQSFMELSQTIKAHLPRKVTPQPTADPCSNADSEARRRLCRSERENPEVRYHLVLERNVGLRCEDADHNPGYNQIDLDDIPEEFFIGKGECAYLAGADLRAYELANFNFSGAYMRKANLNGVDLSGSNFYEANLSQADLRGADLRGAKNLASTNLKGAIFDMKTKFPWEENQAAKLHGMICQGDPDWCMDQ